MLAATVWIGACSSGDGPSSPTEVALPEEVAGRWLGVSRIETAQGGGCLGPTFRSKKGEEESIEVELVETAGALSGSMRFTETGNLCTVSGTLELTRVSLAFELCDLEVFDDVPCNAVASRSMVLAAARFAGIAGEGAIRGTLQISYFTFSGEGVAPTSVVGAVARKAPLAARVPEEGTELLVESTIELHR